MVLFGHHRYSNITVKQKNKLSQIMNQANKITGYKQNSLQVLFDCFMEKNCPKGSCYFKSDHCLKEMQESGWLYSV